MQHLPEGRASDRAGHRPAPRPSAAAACSSASSSGCSQLSRDAEAMAEKLGDDQRLARVYTYLINYHYLKGEPELAVEYGERCLRIGDSVNDRRAPGARARLSRLQLPRPGTLPAGRVRPQAERRGPRERVGTGGRAPDRDLVRHLDRLARLHAGRAGRVRCGGRVPGSRAARGRGQRARLHAHHRADARRTRLAPPRSARSGAAAAPEEPGHVPREEPRRLAADSLVAAGAHVHPARPSGRGVATPGRRRRR